MGEATREAHAEVVRARAALSGEVDELGSAVRSSLDIPAKVRRKPLQTAGIAAGAAFLVVGGPKRILQRVETALRGGKPKPPKGLLPREVERITAKLGPDGDAVRVRLEREFAAYLREKSKKGQLAGGPRESAWRLFDAIAIPLGAQTARRLTERLFAADPNRPPVPEEAEKASGTEVLLEDAAVVAAQEEPGA
jgi:hypothetical protein